LRILKKLSRTGGGGSRAEDIAAGSSVEIWFQDEMRVGQKNGLVYQWAAKGTRPRQPKDQRYANAYLFGAICPVYDDESGCARCTLSLYREGKRPVYVDSGPSPRI
jgi:hypothetical protein